MDNKTLSFCRSNKVSDPIWEGNGYEELVDWLEKENIESKNIIFIPSNARCRDELHNVNLRSEIIWHKCICPFFRLDITK